MESRCSPALIICRFVMNILRYIPPLFVTAIYLWGLISYLYYLWSSSYPIYIQILCVIVFVVFFIMAVWCYFYSLCKNHLDLPMDFEIPDNIDIMENTVERERSQMLEEIIETRNLPIHTRSTFSFNVNYCRKCRVVKADRTHHCSQCGKCIRKMDHHCVWIGNCVGFANYKAFILFLFFTTVLGLFTSGTTVPYALDRWKSTAPDLNLTLLALFPAMLSVSTSFLLIFHLILIARNQTTIETYQGPSFKSPHHKWDKFSLGCGENFRQVFGDNCKYWLLPHYPSKGDGVTFKLRGSTLPNPALEVDHILSQQPQPSSESQLLDV